MAMRETCNDEEKYDIIKVNDRLLPEPNGDIETRTRVSVLVNAFNAMRMRSKQICFVLALSITALAALHNGTLRMRKASIPIKFFDSPIITDYTTGNLKELSLRSLQSEVSFVMYYAPWDSECIRSKREFETVAKHFNRQIFIASINCWWNDGECRKYYNLRRYPLLLAHVRSVGEIEYRGPLIADYIIPFLDNILDPIVPVHNEGDLLDLRAKHDAVLVGHFDFNESPHPPGYKQFFTTALRALSNDPWRSVSYSVITNKNVASKLKHTATLTLTLYLTNQTEHYSSKSFKVPAILSWVYSRVEKLSALRWLTPSGIKSDALSKILTKHPTLVLFTPRSFIFGMSPYFDVLREVVMDYYNCDNSPNIRAIIHRSILRRHLIEERLIELEEKCHEMQDPEKHLIAAAVAWNSTAVMEGDTCCHSQVVNWRLPGKTVNKKCFCTACVHVSLMKCPANCKRFNCLATAERYLDTFDPESVNSTATFCNEIRSSYQPKYTPYYRIIVSCLGTPPQPINEFSEFISSNREDLRHDSKIEKMVHEFELQHCQRLNLGLNYSDINFPDSADGEQNWRTNFTGLSCRTNRTLNFVALDSILFPQFAENLGIDVFNATHSTVAVIIDSENENVYILNDYFDDRKTMSKKSFVEFIKNYTSNNLQRFLRSASVSTFSGHCLADDKQVICVPEITEESFARIVLDSSKDVVLMYYAPWCGFCSSIAHIYLSVARLFSDVKGIAFARINGDANDLPWEYTVDRYPTILFFPAKRKAESVSYPSNLPFTTSNLLQFILTNAQLNVRLQTSLQLCNRSCLMRNLVTYSSHSQQLSRRINKDLNEYTLLLKEIMKIRDNKKLTKKMINQLNELELFKNNLIDRLRNNREKFKNLSILRDMIIAKLNNYDSNSKGIDDESLYNIMELMRNKDDDLVKDLKNSSKVKDNIKEIKPKTKYSKEKSNVMLKKDEL